MLREELGTGRVVLVPVWCLGWAQARVHSEMIFTSGDYKDARALELTEAFSHPPVLSKDFALLRNLALSPKP